MAAQIGRTGKGGGVSRFENEIESGLDRCLVNRETGIVIGVSGGADSVSLLRGLDSLRDRIGRLHIAHLDHGLRDVDSTEDAAWVAALAKRHDIAITTHTVDIREEMARRRCGMEEASRHVRRQFLIDVARQEGFSAVALAHTEDDQAETILHHIVRGTGLRGLRGMAWRSSDPAGISVIRPLLATRRETIETYLKRIGQSWRTDASNSDPQWTRNRIRHDLLPRLAADYNRQIHSALIRLAAQADEVDQIVHSTAAQVLHAATRSIDQDCVILAADGLATNPRHVIRSCLVALWIDQGWPRQAMGFDHWDGLAEILLEGGARTLPGGFEARRRHNEFVVRRLRPTGAPPDATDRDG